MTLVGVLIGITILSIALAAQIRLLGNTIKREAELRNVIIATNLAREGIEIAFSQRITSGWKVLGSLKNRKLCGDIGGSPLILGSVNCQDKELNYVNYGTGSGFNAYLYENRPVSYNYNIPSFWRTVEIKDCVGESDKECLDLVSTVGWDKNDLTKNVKLTKKIYNWYVP